MGIQTVVVTEDEADIRGLIQAILGASGIDVRTAPTGTTGINAVFDHVPDFVILDFDLPDIYGLEVIELIRIFTNVHILMFTGHEDIAEKLTLAGANAVMTKPFRPRALKARSTKHYSFHSKNHKAGLRADALPATSAMNLSEANASPLDGR
ncbi:response regulator transcription factor [Arthrobacter sp. ISL-28]|uniref:response regulator transcription factor n=1 Tax=Arthrobacter sp. ISL-28 TaxID=2819108 RepID=UPI001BE616B4|nr:response regulator [Arthrobacter sp. ISL-28]MBT2521827.1 response regulator [Arthrobacter sp. ISL-28]